MKAFFVKLRAKSVVNKALCVVLSLFFIVTAGLFVSSCGKKECKHNYELVIVVEPTCTEQGYTTYRCSKCKETKNDDFVPANGHTFRNGECVYCHEKQIPDESGGGSEQLTEQEFYANMLISVAETDGCMLEVSELNVKAYIKNEISDSDGNASVTFEKSGNAMEINIEKASFSFDENGQIFGMISGTASMSGGDNLFLYEDENEFSAVLKNGILYSEICAVSSYADDANDVCTRRWERIPIENVMLISETGAADSFTAIYEAINAIGANIDEIKSEIRELAGSAYGLQKLVVENLFVKSAVNGGYEFRFDPGFFEKAVDYIFDNTASDIIDDIFGEKASEKISAFALSSMNKTLDVILSDLKAFGIDYEDILEGLDDVYFRFTGEEDYFTSAVRDLLNRFEGMKLKKIIADSAQMSEADVMGIANEIIDAFGTKNIVEVCAMLFINPPEGETIESTVSEFRGTLDKAAESITEMLGTDAFGFNTDINGRITSFPVHLVDFLISDSESISGKYSKRIKTLLNAKIEVKPGKLEDMTDFDETVAEIDGYMSVKPNTTVQGEFRDVTLEFVADENGMITELNVLEKPSDSEIDELALIDGYYTFGNYGYCGNWLSFDVYYYVGYSYGYSEIGSTVFYCNTETGELTSERPEYHDFEIIEEESDLVCGGKQTLKCSVCGYSVTATVAHVGDLVQTYELAKKDGSCVDGVIVTTICPVCQKVVDKTLVYGTNHFYAESDTEDLAIPGQNENCGFKLSRCICGKQITPDADSYGSFERIFCNDGLTEPQEQIDGVFDPNSYAYEYGTLNYSYKYTCSDCDLAVYYDVGWNKADNCTAELSAVLRYERGSDSGIIKTYVYETHTYHDYTVTETENKETGLYSVKFVCKDCGSSYECVTQQYTDKNGTRHDESITTVVNKLNDEKPKRVEERSITIDSGEYRKEEHTTLTITSDGREIVGSEKSETELYDEGIPAELENGIKTVYVKDGITTEQVTAKSKVSEKTYILYEYTENEDGTWVKKEYTYDFESGCKYTVKITNNNGTTSEETGSDHDLFISTIKEASCASDGICAEACRMCGQVIGEEFNIGSEGHEFATHDEHDNLICTKCGALEETDYIAILKMYGFVTEDKTDYENGADYVVAYDGLQRDGFTLSLVLREKYGISESRKEFGLALAKEDFIVDATNRTISFDKVTANALVKAKIKELGIDADDYYLTLNITVVVGEKTVTLHRELKSL